MTAFLTKTNATSTLSYHTADGFVHIIPRPSLGLGQVADSKIVSLLTNFDKPDKPRWYCDYLVIFKLATKATKVYVTLGCGAIVRFDYSACEYLQGEGKHSVELDQLEIVSELPLEIDASALYPELDAFRF